MKNLSQSVMILDRIVAVAPTSAGTPNPTKSVVMAISGSPTSKGTPIGTDLTATTIAEVIRIALHETGRPSDRNTIYGMLKLQVQFTASRNNATATARGLRRYSCMES